MKTKDDFIDIIKENEGLIFKVTQLYSDNGRYQGALSKIYKSELTAAILTLIFSLLILINLGKLDTLLFKSIGIFLALMFTTPLFTTLKAVKQMQNIDLEKTASKDVLIEFISLRQKFFLEQKLMMIGGILVFVLGFPIALKITFETYSMEMDLDE